jgi:nicotinamide mononucleotide transporter
MLFDFIGAFLSLIATYYFINISNKAWFFSLLAISLNGYLYWQKGIYADMVLEGIYCCLTGYGWFLWRPSNYSTSLDSIVTKLLPYQWLLLIAVILSGYAMIWLVLTTYTHSTIASLDALTTSLSLTAQWLLARKIIMTWLIWFITDAIYIYLYLIKHLPFHALLMISYTGLAIWGYYTWYQCHQKNLITKMGF